MHFLYYNKSKGLPHTLVSFKLGTDISTAINSVFHEIFVPGPLYEKRSNSKICIIEYVDVIFGKAKDPLFNIERKHYSNRI